MLNVIFILLTAAVFAFFLMICLTLFRIERAVKITLTIAERTILKNYGKR
jgi:hypothetical protein